MSIAFGGLCFIMAFFLGDIKRFLTDYIAAPPTGDPETGPTFEEVQRVKAGETPPSETRFL